MSGRAFPGGLHQCRKVHPAGGQCKPLGWGPGLNKRRWVDEKASTASIALCLLTVDTSDQLPYMMNSTLRL